MNVGQMLKDLGNMLILTQEKKWNRCFKETK